MTRFILIAGAMLACSLLFVLPPLLRREVGGDAPVKLPRQRWPVILVGLFVPLLAASLYALLGTPAALERPSEPALAAASPGAAVGPEQVEAMVARLATRLAKEPNDANGWRMLARSYETLRRFDQASDAYRHLLALEPATPELLVDYAVVLGMTLNTSLVGEPEVADRPCAGDRPESHPGPGAVGQRGAGARRLCKRRQAVEEDTGAGACGFGYREIDLGEHRPSGGTGAAAIARCACAGGRQAASSR